jgi:hypothetical protein
MKKTITRLLTVALLGLSLAMTACTGDTNSNNLTSIPGASAATKVGNIQGKIMDATTGQPIAFSAASYKSGDVQIFLVRGNDAQTPSKYIWNSADTLAGEYAFTSVPFNVDTVGATAATTNATYKIVIQAKGYQRFESEFQPSMFWNSKALISTGAGTIGVGANTANLYDEILNRIANIYLFPIGVSSVDYKTRVMYNGKPVPSATVVLQQNSTTDVATTETQATLAGSLGDTVYAAASNRLYPSPGLLPLLTGTTDADGYVTFPASSLVLGGNYTPIVLPFKAAAFEGGVQLERKTAPAFVVGDTVTATFTIQMVSLEANAGYNTGSLYIAKTEPSLEDALLTPNAAISAGGVVKVTFNRPVQLNDATTANSYTAPVAATATAAAVTEKLNYVGYWATLTSTNSAFLTTMYAPAGSIPSGLTYPNYRGVLATDPAGTLSVYTSAITANKPVVASLSTDGLVLTLTPQFVTGFNAANYYDLKVTFSETSAVNTFGGATQQQKPSISPVAHPEQRYSLFGTGATQVKFNNGNALKNEVYVTGPRP